MGDGSGLETWNPEQERDEDESPGEKAGAPRGRAGTEAQPRASCGGQSLTGGPARDRGRGLEGLAGGGAARVCRPPGGRGASRAVPSTEGEAGGLLTSVWFLF